MNLSDMKERDDIWEFDVSASTHDLLQQGLTEPFKSRIVLSKEEFPDFLIAENTAGMWSMTGKKDDRMCTATRIRI